MQKEATGKRKSGVWLAILAGIAAIAAAVIAGPALFGGNAQDDLSAALAQWTAEWKDGDASALSEGMIFGVPQAGKAEDEDDLALSAGELKAMMEEQYAALIEARAEVQQQKRLFPILMRHTAVAYALPQRVEAGEVVTFEITGPDMAALLPLLDENDTQQALLGRLEALLSAGGYAQRTVSVQVEIEALDEGYRLETTYALLDGLYGGLLGVVGGALPAVE